jgi:hypothetical protein
MKTYYIYHIKGVKWGCTNNLKKRFPQMVNGIKYILTDVCEIIEINDIDEASELEMQCNIRDGYGWNLSQDYRIICKASILGGKKQGPVTGKKNVDSGHWDEIRKLASSKSSREKAVKNTDYKKIATNNEVPILQFDLMGNFIAEYKSIKQASQILSIQSSNITNTAKGRYPHYKKFIWKYKPIIHH